MRHKGQFQVATDLRDGQISDLAKCAIRQLDF
jgi:hypothetical protein